MPTVYAATDCAVVAARGEPDGDWTATWHPFDSRPECLAAADTRVFVGTAAGELHRSPDGGLTWDVATSRGDRVTAVTVDPSDPERVWAGTEPSRVFVSTDGGDSWTERPGLADLPSANRWSFPPRPHTHHVRWIAVDPYEPERLYVAIEAGAFLRSPDGGESWLDHLDGARRDTHTIATHPDAPGRLYVAAGDGYAESTDGGKSWTYPQTGLDHRYVWSVAVAPEDPDTVFVSAASGPRAAHDPDGTSAVYQKLDGAWSLAMDGLPGPDGLGRAVLASGPETVYAATNHGLYRLIGAIWERLPVEWSTPQRAELPRGLAVVG